MGAGGGGSSAQARLAGGCFGRAGEGGVARELPLQPGREEGRRFAGKKDGGAMRRLRQRRLRRRAPRRSEHPPHREVRAGCLRRAVDGGGDRGAVQGARAPRASPGGDRRRSESLDQTCGARRAPLSGTDRSVYVSSTSSGREQRPSLKRSPDRVRIRSPAVAKRSLRLRNTGSPTGFPTSRPAVVLSWSSSKARNCPRSRCWSSAPTPRRLLKKGVRPLLES